MSSPNGQPGSGSDSPRLETMPGFEGAPSPFTCVTTPDASRGSCFVANCLQLVGAVRSGVAHITLYRHLDTIHTPGVNQSGADAGSGGRVGVFEACHLPLTITRPLTIRGACSGADGGNGAPCVIDGGGRLTRRPRDTCRQHCTTCEGGGGPIFDVRPGGDLTLINLELRNACNSRDGAGGAVVVRGKPGRACAPGTLEAAQSSTWQCPMGRSCVSGATGARSEGFGDYGENDDFAWDQGVEGRPTKGSSGQIDSGDDEHDHDKNHAGALTMIRVTVRDSVAYGRGGVEAKNGRGGGVALLNRYARAVFTECTFVGNEAWGGVDSDDLFLGGSGGLGTVVDYSTNLGEGGGVYVNGAAVTFDRCTFEDQTAEKEGGAVYADAGATVRLDGCTFRNNRVHDDYWDGGGALFVSGAETTVTMEITRFEDNAVTVYPDSRRKALTCGGGAVTVVRGATASFTFVLFAGNSAPRGGAVCVHDATASYKEVVFRANTAKHMWFDQPPGFDVECVQCFALGLTGRGHTSDEGDGDTVGGGPRAPSGDRAEAENQNEAGTVIRETVVVAELNRCAYRRDADATATFETPRGPQPVCAPPPGAFKPSFIPAPPIASPSPASPTMSSSSSSSSFASWGSSVGAVQSMSDEGTRGRGGFSGEGGLFPVQLFGDSSAEEDQEVEEDQYVMEMQSVGSY